MKVMNRFDQLLSELNELMQKVNLMKRLLLVFGLLLYFGPAHAQSTITGALLTGLAPAASIGKEGDFFFDAAAYQVWGPKTSGSWGSVATYSVTLSGVAFAASATVNANNSSNHTSGTEPMGRLSNVGGVHCGSLVGANFNATTDQSIAISVPGTKWMPFRVEVSNPSVSLDTAVGGIYTAASKGGVALIAANQAYSALTTNAANTSGNGLNLTPTTVSTVYTLTALILSLSTPQGAAATADVDIYCLALR